MDKQTTDIFKLFKKGSWGYTYNEKLEFKLLEKSTSYMPNILIQFITHLKNRYIYLVYNRKTA